MNNFQIGDWFVDVSASELIHNEQVITVQYRVMALLLYFAAHPNKVIGKDELVAEVWQGAVITDDAVVNTVVKLRKVLGDSAKAPRFIETLPKVGYRFVAEVVEVAANPQADAVPLGQPVTSNSQAPARAVFTPKKTAVLLLMMVVLSFVFWIHVENSPVSHPLPGSAPGLTVRSIAILPLVNLSGGHETDYFADGLTEEIINSLTANKHLQVAARTSSFVFKENPLPVETIAQQLAVDYLLQGSVRRYDNKVRVSVQLIDAINHVTLWNKDFDRQINDVLQLQAEIALLLSQSLQHNFAAAPSITAKPLDEAQLIAQDLYWQAQFQLRQRTITSIAKGIDLLKTLVSGPYVSADYHLLLAKAYLLSASYGNSSAEDQRALALASIQYAQSMDPENPSISVLTGLYFLGQGQLHQAQQQLLNAIRYLPNDAEAQLWLAEAYQGQGELVTANQWFSRAKRLDPLNLTITRYLARNAMLRGKFNQGEVLLQSLLDSDEPSAQIELELARWTSNYGLAEKTLHWAQKAWAKEPQQVESYIAMAFGLLHSGQTAQAYQWLLKAQQIAPTKALIFHASVNFYFIAGDKQGLDLYLQTTIASSQTQDISTLSADHLRWLGINHFVHQRYVEAETLLALCLTKQQAPLSVNLETFEAMVFYALSLIRQHKAGANEAANTAGQYAQTLQMKGWSVPFFMLYQQLLANEATPQSGVSLTEAQLQQSLRLYPQVFGLVN